MTILASDILAAGGGGASIANIYQGSITVTGLSNTATIPAVDLTKSVVMHLGQTSATALDANDAYSRLVLTNNTTVGAFRQSSGGTIITRYMVIEFSSGINYVEAVQGAPVSGDGNAYIDVTLGQTVDLSKTALFWGGFGTTGINEEHMVAGELLDADTVRFYIGGVNVAGVANATVVEFS